MAWVVFGTISIFIFTETGVFTPHSSASLPLSIVQSVTDTAQSEKEGRKYYQAGQFFQAIQIWQQVFQIYETQGDILNQARVLSNLSLAYQKLGEWQQATDAITKSLKLVKFQNDNLPVEQLKVFAQTLNTQASLQLATGETQTALETWEKAYQIYTQAKDKTGMMRSLLNQSQALQHLGFNRKAFLKLTQVQQILDTKPDSLIKASGLRSLGNSFRLVGKLDLAEDILYESLTIAKNLQSSPDISAVLIDLGNLARVREDYQLSLDLYQQATVSSTPKILKVRSQINQLSLAIDTKKWDLAQSLWPQIQTEISQLPVNRQTIYSRLNFAESLIRLHQANIRNTPSLSLKIIAQLVANTAIQAEKLGDRQAESYALGKLGKLYEITQQFSIAQEVTQKALTLAETINAPEIAYRWQWQLGRLLKKQGEIENAIANYTQAVQNLQSLRGDLIAVDTDIQFSFQESVEPVYRELVSLLLEPGTEPSQKSLQQARQVIQNLQLAELEDFFRAACVDNQLTPIDQIDNQAAIIYPIILSDRLEVILSLPGKPLQHYSSPISQQKLENLVENQRQKLVIRSRYSFMPISRQLYNYLLRPAEKLLNQSDVKTLVFVLDGVLKNIPMAALHDGNQFLLEKYNIALFPGLQMQSSQKLVSENINVLGAGLTQARQGFSPLAYVEIELNKINSEVPSTVLLNQEFTQDNLKQQLESNFFPIIHIATHGKFSSKAIETFILTWNDKININDLDNLLQFPQQNQQRIELLVLSACETATGDKRAALGLAGMAVKAGASSTLATLWSVNDQATSVVMNEFYKELQKKNTTKAEALRNSQLALLKDPLYSHPVYWSPYVLVGNWQ